MAGLGPFFSRFTLSLLLLIIHLGCFTLSPKHRPPKPKKRKPPQHNPHNNKPLLPSCWSSLKHLVALKSRHSHGHGHSHHSTGPESAPASARSSQNSTSPFINPLQSARSDAQRDGPSTFIPEYDVTAAAHHQPFFLVRNQISPCPVCGEVFQKSHLLQQHQWAEHPVSELGEGESGKNVIRIIFTSGWSGTDKSPTIHRILRIHNSPKVLARFEEHREAVKLKAAARNGVVAGRRRHLDERCMADGNELLRFHCSTFLCDLGEGGGSSVCSHAFCSACGIIRGGFSPKMDGIATLSSSWKAHVAIPTEMEEEFAFMNVKRAMLVCRVVAGRIGCWGDRDGGGDADKGDGGFDSMLGSRSHDGAHSGAGAEEEEEEVEEEELLLFNPRAVLPCFVIVYSV